MSLALDPQTEQRIQRHIDRGHFHDSAEVIAHALNLLDAQEEWFSRNREAISERIEESAAQAERGEVYTAEEAARLLDENIAARVLQRA
jgi:Arc/MetJ-type ribon-helix-helix transcriptional regulator